MIGHDRKVPVKLGLNDNTGYSDPVNVKILKQPYLYFGFLPITLSQNNYVQGIKVRRYVMIIVTAADGNDRQTLAFELNYI